MLHFGKKFRFGKIARDDEEETGEEEQAHFAPVILTEDRAPVRALPSLDFEEEQDDLKVENLPNGAEVSEISRESALEDGFEDLPDAPEEERAADEPQTEEEPQKEEELPEKEDPQALFDELRALPYAARVYGLYGSRMLLSYPVEQGVYLFEENGEYLLAKEEDCAAFLRVCGAEGSFRAKRYRTNDLEYILEEKTFPLSFIAKDAAQLHLAEEDGFLPYKQASGGRGIEMIKPLSLYRMKDLSMRVEYSGGKNGGESDEYVLDFEKSLIEEAEGARHFQRICRAAAELINRTEQPFFEMQVLKVRRNLAVCFPMDGKPAIGDIFGGDRITDLAQAEDGSCILRIGAADDVKPRLTEGARARGQHRLRLTFST